MPDTPFRSRIAKALLTLVAWISASMIVGALTRHGAMNSMADLVAMLSSTVLLGVVAGIIVLAVASRGLTWGELGFVRPRLLALLRFLWFPLLVLLPIPVLAYAIGLPPNRAIAFMALNTTLIALSEEWMFRGVLFHALRARLNFWPAVSLTTVCFGGLHVLNAFALGDLFMALAQSVAAMMTGLLLLALMLRTGTIWTAILYHMLWNFGILLVAYEASAAFDPTVPLPLSAYLTPMLIVLPNFLYALVLLRRVPRGPVALADDLNKS